MPSKSYLIIISVLLLPLISFAKTQTLASIISIIAGYLTTILALMMGLAVVFFVWYVIKYFIQSSDTKRAEAAQYVMWSVIGFFVIFSLWGIVNILINTFNLGSNNAPSSWSTMSDLFPGGGDSISYSGTSGSDPFNQSYTNSPSTDSFGSSVSNSDTSSQPGSSGNSSGSYNSATYQGFFESTNGFSGLNTTGSVDNDIQGANSVDEDAYDSISSILRQDNVDKISKLPYSKLLDLDIKNFRASPIDNSKSVNGYIKYIYDGKDIPRLSAGQVLIAGKHLSGENYGKDDFYIVDKNTFASEGYVLSAMGSINTNDGRYYPLMVIHTKKEAQAYDLEKDSKYFFTNTDPEFLKYAKESIEYNEPMFVDYLKEYKGYGSSLPANMSQAEKERKVYDYVNDKIVSAPPDNSLYDDNHKFNESCIIGQGVCRDKSPALISGLKAAGIDAAQVYSSGHTFVAVMKSDGTVDHYLDPMWYETYLPLARPNVDRSQIFR
jgi:hypothetical protein